MDSVTMLALLAEAGDKIHALSFDYGQRHSKELAFAARAAEKYADGHEIMNIDQVFNAFAGESGSSLINYDVDVPEGHYAEESMKATVVPNRNMILLSLATGFAVANGMEGVAYAAHAGDHTIYPDCRTDFMQAMSIAMRRCDWNPPALWVPFAHFTKSEIAALGISLGIDYEVETWSCYKGGDEHCGVCGTCVERFEALNEAPDLNAPRLKRAMGTYLNGRETVPALANGPDVIPSN
jgi:7-cyano-7-deazaguanine synthase